MENRKRNFGLIRRMVLVLLIVLTSGTARPVTYAVSEEEEATLCWVRSLMLDFLVATYGQLWVMQHLYTMVVFPQTENGIMTYKVWINESDWGDAEEFNRRFMEFANSQDTIYALFNPPAYRFRIDTLEKFEEALDGKLPGVNSVWPCLPCYSFFHLYGNRYYSEEELWKGMRELAKLWRTAYFDPDYLITEGRFDKETGKKKPLTKEEAERYSTPWWSIHADSRDVKERVDSIADIIQADICEGRRDVNDDGLIFVKTRQTKRHWLP